MNMSLRFSFLAFTLLSLLSTLDFDVVCIYKRECEISEKRVKTTVSPENVNTYGVEISAEISVERKRARERRGREGEKEGREGRRPLERRVSLEGG